MKPDPNRIILEVRLELADGTSLGRDVRYGEPMPEALKSPPPWLENPRRAWPHPQGPITMAGNVPAGHEDDARAWIKSE